MLAFLNLSLIGQEVLLGILIVLTFLTIVFHILGFIKKESTFIRELISRTHTWWIILVFVVVGFFIHTLLTYITVAILIILSYRELLVPLQFRGVDKNVLRWAYFLLPCQLFFAYIDYFNAFVLWIPVISFMFITFIIVFKQEIENITRSIGMIHWTLMATVFSFSHLAYIFTFHWPANYVPADLLLFLLLATEANDIFQFTFGKLFGKHKILDKISPKKTVEGFLGGLISTTILGYFMHSLVPLPLPKLLVISALVAFVGFCGDVTFSAFKREAGVKDMSTLLPGHGGILDRADSLAFTSMVFFHFVRVWSGA